MSKIEKIRQKIKRLKSTNPSEYNYQNAEGYIWALNDLLSFLDTLEEEPDKDLEEAARNNADSTVVDTRIEYCGTTEDVYFYTKLLDAFIAGAQWQEKRNKETIKTAEDHAFLAGADWQKEQMLEDAVEGEAEELYNDGESQCTVGVGTYFKPGEKVYVLKAMEDEE